MQSRLKVEIRVGSQERREQIIEESPATIPVVKLVEPLTYGPEKFIQTPMIVVRMQDILTPKGNNFNRQYHEIEEAGGLHKYLDYGGQIMLSLIMQDKTIFGCKTEQYIEAINTLMPNAYTTPDGETYYGEVEVSMDELNRMLCETECLLHSCPSSEPMGLIKGCNLKQIGHHTEELKSLGLDKFIFHSGDYLASGKDRDRMFLLRASKSMHKRVNNIYYYGLTSPKIARYFPHARGFITQGHYTNAFYGLRMKHMKRLKAKRVQRGEDHTWHQHNLIMQNLQDIKEGIDLVFGNYTEPLSIWETQAEETGYPTPKTDILVEETAPGLEIEAL
jgi:hypothetical protein